jgi:predicted Zn-dependent protease
MPRPAEPSRQIETLERRLAADPGSLLFVPLAEAYRRQGRLEDAERVLRAGLDRHPGHHSARTSLGRVLLLMDRAQEAARELQRVVDEVPDNLLARRLLDEAAGPSLPAPEEPPARTEAVAVSPAPPGPVEEPRTPALPSSPPAPPPEPEGGVEASTVPLGPPSPPEREDPGLDVPSPADELSSVTLAELYLRQGDRDRALAIYRDVLLREPEHPGWRRRYEELVGESTAAPEPAPAPQATAAAAAAERRRRRIAGLERYLTQVRRARVAR